jgi:diguanylate cyclase (GGDEF)-like protein
MTEKIQPNYRVLIVDDNDAIHKDFRRILSAESESTELASVEDAIFGAPAAKAAPSRAAFEIQCALQGEEGFAMARNARQAGTPFSVAFIDMRMPPGWDGLRTIEEIWKCDPDLNVVICTAYSDHSWDDIEAVGGKSDRLLVLKKPFEPIEVRRMATTLAAKWTLGRQAEMKMSELEDMVGRRTEELNHAATHDRLTGLPNRALFHERVTQALEVSRRRQDVKVAVLFLDLDRFKIVNDSLGHGAGDELLCSISNRLTSLLRATDTVVQASESTTARLGGDEFCVLLNGHARDEDVVKVAGRILKELERPYTIAGQPLRCSASIGIALNSAAYSTADEMIRDADTAMYRAKTDGKGRFVIFDKELHDQAVHRLDLENALRNAIEKNELRAYFQPVVCLETGTLMGAEALVRWQHPKRGLIGPGEFIGVAEDGGLIAPLGLWMLEVSARQLKAWETRFPEQELTVSVNVSGKQLSSNEFQAQVRSIVQNTGVNPEMIIFELTETALVSNPEVARKALVALKEMGIRVHLDDFGTGYSSLSLLHTFKLDGLKIDRSFVKNAAEARPYAAIIRAIAELAQNLGLSVVAEGIESREQVALLQSLGCDLGQGFLFSKALPAEEFERFLEGHGVHDWKPFYQAA